MNDLNNIEVWVVNVVGPTVGGDKIFEWIFPVYFMIFDNVVSIGPVGYCI